MTDAVTISRETLQAAVDALECALSDSRPYIVKSREVSTTLRAALAAQPAEPVACKGIPRKGCNYLAPTDTVCNKCGKIHHHHQMLAHFYAASPAPAAVPPGYVLVPIEPTQAILDAPFVGKVQPQDWHSHKRSRELMAENYRAMIAAAPKDAP